MSSTRSESSADERNVFVLSGGAARGAVQVGMLQVLLEHGIVPHALVGHLGRSTQRGVPRLSRRPCASR